MIHLWTSTSYSLRRGRSNRFNNAQKYMDNKNLWGLNRRFNSRGLYKVFCWLVFKGFPPGSVKRPLLSPAAPGHWWWKPWLPPKTRNHHSCVKEMLFIGTNTAVFVCVVMEWHNYGAALHSITHYASVKCCTFSIRTG